MHPNLPSSTGESSAAPASAFPPTTWTIVQQARSDDADRALAAVQTLCIRYQRAIHAWFRRSRPPAVSPGRAEEWAQDFLLWICEKNLFARVERRQSKFRAFLVTCLRNFLKNKLEAERALKRGAGAEHLELEPLELASAADDASLTLDAELAASIHDQVLGSIRDQWRAKGDEARFEALQARILGGGGEQGYPAIATTLGLKPNHIKKIVFDLREAYCQAFRREVANLIHDRAELENEFHYLIGLLIRRELNRATE